MRARWLLIGLLAACADSEPGGSAEPADTSVDTASACTGEVGGRVFAGAGTFDPFPDAVVVFEGDDDLETTADGSGIWSAELPAGDWIVSARDQSGSCISSEQVPISLECAGSLELDLYLDQCI